MHDTKECHQRCFHCSRSKHSLTHYLGPNCSGSNDPSSQRTLLCTSGLDVTGMSEGTKICWREDRPSNNSRSSWSLYPVRKALAAGHCAASSMRVTAKEMQDSGIWTAVTLRHEKGTPNHSNDLPILCDRTGHSSPKWALRYTLFE